MTLTDLFLSVLKPHGHVNKLIYRSPDVKVEELPNRFSGMTTTRTKKTLGLRCKLTTTSGVYKCKIKLEDITKIKASGESHVVYCTLELREKKELQIRTQREKEQIGLKLKRKIGKTMDIVVKEVIPAKVMFQWSMDQVDFDLIHEYLEIICHNYFAFDFTQQIPATEPLR